MFTGLVRTLGRLQRWRSGVWVRGDLQALGPLALGDRWQRLFLPAFSLVINCKKNYQLKCKIHALMQIRQLVMQ
jgi:hypothetical protein